ncbi:MAG: 50S ribosomal protein L7Ae [Candidatus Anstonellaceae archaeon]
MASYILYETPKEIVAKTLEALTIASESGRVKKGANETTKSIEAKRSLLVVIASDVEPQEVVMHLPALCKEYNVPFLYVPTKKDLGGALGLAVPCSAASVESGGNAQELLDSIINRVAPLCGVNLQKSKEETKEEKKEQSAQKAPKESKKKK